MADLPKTQEAPKVGLFQKVLLAADAALDSYITKSKTDGSKPASKEDKAPYMDQKAFNEVDHLVAMQYGYQEKQGLISFDVLKQMARKDSIIVSIIQTRMSQISNFGFLQKDRYSPGFMIVAKEPADIDKEDKVDLVDPTLEEEEIAEKRHELEKEKMKKRIQQEKDIKEIEQFLLNCGRTEEEMLNDKSQDPIEKMDFDTFLKLIVKDRLTYNYAAIEMVPTKDGRLHHFMPVSAGTIRRVTKKSAEAYTAAIKDLAIQEANINGKNVNYSSNEAVKYVQLIRGKVVAAFLDEELIFEPGTPSVDPEDRGYAPGELELLIQIITAHLFAESHNRNFFTQGIGSKGILHIKGENTSRAQLEGFKRQWYSQMVNSRNAFRPPIIGMADEVKWIPLTQTNREMEFQAWMEYLIKICCAVFQIDPSEINFDISRTNVSTLNEGNNEQRLKSSKDKGLSPLLTYVEKIINGRILPAWDKEKAKNYKFQFAGLDAETREQEADRLDKETKIWKTINEARTDMGFPPIEDGDVIRDATYTQYKQMKMTQEQQMNPMGMENLEGESQSPDINEDVDSLAGEIDAVLSEDAPTKEDKAEKAIRIEYHHFEK